MFRVVRPLWIIGVTWAAVCLVGAWVSITVLMVTTASGVLFAVIGFSVASLRRHHGLLLSAVTAILALGVLLYWQAVRYLPTVCPDGTEVSVCAEVQEDGTLTVLSGALPTGTRLQLWKAPIGAVLHCNDTVTATFRIRMIGEEGLSRLSSKASGVWLGAMPTDLSGESWEIVRGDPDEGASLSALREELVIRIRRILPNDLGAVITGICLGADEELSAEAVSDFRACGVSHLFAVSGLHLAILTQALLGLLTRLRFSRRLRGWLCVLAVIGFSTFVGWTPSVTRAATICLVVIVGRCVRRQADTRNSLGAALLLLLIADPFAIYDVGLLLSFTATCGVLFISPLLKQWLMRAPMPGVLGRVWRPIASAVALTLSATLAGLPVTVLYFGTVSLVGILANLLMTFPASVILVVGWIAILSFPLALSFLYYPLLLFLGMIAKLLLWLAQGIAALPFSTVTLTEPYLIIAVIGGLAIAGIGWLLLRGRGVRLAALLCTVTLCFGVLFYQYRLRDTVRFLVIANQSDLAVCAVYRARTILVIAPTRAETVYAVRSSLRNAGIDTLSAVIIPAGEWSGAPYVSLLLQDYVDESAICHQTDDTAVELQLASIKAAFLPVMDTPPSADTDVVFSTMPANTREDEALWVVQCVAPPTALPKNGIFAQRNEDMWLWMGRNGEFSIQ